MPQKLPYLIAWNHQLRTFPVHYMKDDCRPPRVHGFLLARYSLKEKLEFHLFK